MKFAYADPPYHKQGKKLYGKHHNEAAVWDSKDEHLKLLARLVDEYPDGWALSCNPADLRWLLPAAPEGTRVCTWVKTFHPIRMTSVQFAWEAVLLFGGRKNQQRNPMVRDWYLGKPSRMQKLPGAKTDEFNNWILDLLNFQDCDQLDDLFPGTGGMARAIDRLAIFRQGQEVR
jgi:hypothetical protein